MDAFIGRQQELGVLEREYRRPGGFVVLYGRRRVGKTTLIKQFIRNKPALYFLASQENETLNQRRFASAVAEFTGRSLFDEARFDDWRPLFKAIADHDSPETKVLVIDELPYLVKTNPAFPSILQCAWDETLQGANVLLVLCGSSVHMMHDIALSHASPLYGRRTAQIRLQPLRFNEVREGLPHFGFAQLMERYALTGGVPKYLEFFLEDGDIERDIETHVFSTSGFLYEEPRFLLEQEIRDPVNYLSLLTAIARGARKPSEMANLLERKAGELSPYLKVLADLGYVERRVPFDVERPERSKQGLYYLADAFIDFWFHYVQPFAGELELGNPRPSIEQLGRTFRQSFVPFAFENVSRQALADLCREGKVDFSPSRIGAYWNKAGTVEIDVCAIEGSTGRRFLGECKYRADRPVGADVYEALKRKAESVADRHGAGTVFGLFSRTGFADDLLEEARRDSRLVLVNENEPVRP